MWDFACFVFSVLVFAAGALHAHRRGELFPASGRPPQRPPRHATGSVVTPLVRPEAPTTRTATPPDAASAARVVPLRAAGR